MLGDIFLSAIALVLVLEGILPFLAPDRYKQLMRHLSSMDEKKLRIIGFFSMLFGVVLLFVVHHHLLW